MKMTKPHQPFVLRAIPIAMGLSTCGVLAAPQYIVTDLGTLGGNYSNGQGINDLGDVTGGSTILDNASIQGFHALNGQSITMLGAVLGGPESQGYDINNFGQVTGRSDLPNNTGYHAFIWKSGLPPQDLGTLGGSTSQGKAINDAGHVAGIAATAADTQQHAALWNGTTWQDLGTLGGTSSQGNAINSLDQVTGFSTLATGVAQHAFLWSNGAMRDLGTLGGSYSEGFGINTAGQVTGSSTVTGDTAQHAFLWQSGAAMKDLGTLGGSYSAAYAINTAGDVVGYTTSTGDMKQLAFLWQSGTGMQDLNSLIDPASGWALLEAHTISDAGHITGIGFVKGERHAFLLTNTAGDTTPPVVSFQITPATPAASGWYVTAPSVTWSVSDPQSTVTSKVGCAAVPAVADTAGQTFSCTATSAGGTNGPVITPAIKVDTTKPTFAGVPAAMTPAATSTAGAVVTYTAPTASDSTSLLNASGVTCAPASGSTFPMGLTAVTCSATDNAGNVGTSAFTVTVSDQTPPVITPTVTGTAGANGWFIGPVTVSWSVVDKESAVTSSACASVTIATNGIGQVFSCTGTSSGGTATKSTAPINIDTQAPSFLSCPNSVTITQGQTLTPPAAADNLTTPVITSTPTSLPVGTTPVIWTARDQAGLASTCTQQVTVNASVPATTTDLQVSGKASNGGPQVNTAIFYGFQVKNAGKEAGQNLIFVDVLPSTLRFDSVASTVGTCTAPAPGSAGGTVRCVLGDLAAAQSANVTIGVTPIAIASIANTGQVTTYSIDPNPGNNSSTVPINVKP